MLFCLVVGEKNPFSIKLDRTQTVSELKGLIKVEKRDLFADIGANLLELYHNEIPDDDNLVETVDSIRLENPLRATTSLAKLFKGTPKETTVHILADVVIQKAPKRARYTIPDDVEGLESLLPVCVSFP